MSNKSTAQKTQESKSNHGESGKLGSGIKAWGKGPKDQAEKSSSSEHTATNILYQTKKKTQ